MGRSRGTYWLAAWAMVLMIQAATSAQGTRDTTTYRRIKAPLDAIPAIDTHDHLWPFDRIKPRPRRPIAARAEPRRTLAEQLLHRGTTG